MGIGIVSENQRKSENHVNVKEKKKANHVRKKRKSRPRKSYPANKVKRLFLNDLSHLRMKVMMRGLKSLVELTMKVRQASVEGLDQTLNLRMKKVLERNDHKVDPGLGHVQVVQDHAQDQNLSRVHGQDQLPELPHLQEDLALDQK